MLEGFHLWTNKLNPQKPRLLVSTSLSLFVHAVVRFAFKGTLHPLKETSRHLLSSVLMESRGKFRSLRNISGASRRKWNMEWLRTAGPASSRSLKTTRIQMDFEKMLLTPSTSITHLMYRLMIVLQNHRIAAS